MVNFFNLNDTWNTNFFTDRTLFISLLVALPIIKVFFGFRDLVPVINKTNILAKFMIIIESILNILWHYFKPSLKTKK